MDQKPRAKTVPAWQPPLAATRERPREPEPQGEPAPELVADAPAFAATLLPDASGPKTDPQVFVARTGVVSLAGKGSAGANVSADVSADAPAEVSENVSESAAASGSAPSASPGNSQGDAPQTLGPGAVIGGRYVVQQLVGQGGFAAVYRATDGEIATHEVAVKLLHLPAKSAEAQAAALRELTLIASVSHPSVVQFKDYGWHEGRLFFAMPWYRGRTLGSTMPLSRADARRVFERLAYGLSAMHDAGVCHYDIKPENIFLADIAGFDAGFPVLLDLGIAAKRGEKPTALTPDYASPETAAAMLDGGATKVGTAADVFSLALSLRNVLEPDSATSFGDSIHAGLLQRAQEPIAPPSQPSLRYLEPQFKRWLSIDPEARPTAAEFAAELAVLTLPEERRAERKRLFLRVAPVLLVLGLLTAFLAVELKNRTTQLVQQKQQGRLEEAEANRRLEQLKQESQSEVDEKLQLAMQFKAQRDAIDAQRRETSQSLTAMTKSRDDARSDLRSRTRERDQARADAQSKGRTIETLNTDLARRTSELSARNQELSQLRTELTARELDVERRTRERDQLRSDLTRVEQQALTQSRDMAVMRSELERRDADLKQRTRELTDMREEVARLRRERDDARADRDKQLRQLERVEKERDAARASIEKLQKRVSGTQSPTSAQNPPASTPTTPTWQ